MNGAEHVHPRTMQNAVFLPDRTVFVSGGGAMGETRPPPLLEAEIYDPAANTFHPRQPRACRASTTRSRSCCPTAA